MGIRIDTKDRSTFIFITIVLMLAGLFFSRALLSISMILFIALTCIHHQIGTQVKRFATEPVLIGLSFLFLVPAVTWFWSEDKAMWWHLIRIKLPLLLLPLAFGGRWQLSSKQTEWLAIIFVLLVACGCVWSLAYYINDRTALDTAYLKAKVIPTPFENDHVRFSLVVAIAILGAAVLIKELEQKTARLFLGALVVFFVIYLHVLSARTGLLAFYLFVFSAFVYLLFSKRNRRWMLSLLGIVLLLPFVAWAIFPTFQNRMRYVIYDLSYVRSSSYLPGSNDGVRVLSLKGGWNILQQHPFGVGTGDVIDSTNQWYDQNVPQMLEEDKIYPSSELLMYGAGAGWPGLIIFVIAALLPFFQRVARYRFHWLAVNGALFLSLIYDVGLEVQFGVFIYSFLLLWWWKWFSRPAAQIS